MKEYIKLDSLTWWTGFIAIILGIASMFGVGDWTNEAGKALSMIVGQADASPAGLITMGFGLIGIRRAIRRGLLV